MKSTLSQYLAFTIKKATQKMGGLLCGGDGGDRTRVRKYSALGSTCLVLAF